MTKRNVKIQLKRIKPDRRTLHQFGETLISNLGDNIFEITDEQELLFQVLKQIAPNENTLTRNELSIENACKKIFAHFGIHNQATIKNISGDNYPRKIKTYTQRFMEDVIRIGQLPSHSYRALSKQVSKDLYRLSELITVYESEQCIKDYISKGNIPKSHAQRIVYDFYIRCCNERIDILKFQLYGIKKRAMAKSRYRPFSMPSIQLLIDSFHDRPYYCGRPNSQNYLDYRRINLAPHRFEQFYTDESQKFEMLYVEDKAKFYRIYFRRFPAQQHFEKFNFYLSYIPCGGKREQIFEELIRLFKAQRWISFYALALPQVEGLFTEMCKIVSPQNDFSQQSLPQKVKNMRSFHYYSLEYFDYYQYHIPLQRNQFAHTGYDVDFKLKSYDLLIDLSHLLKIFHDLDNPLIQITKLHTRKNPEDFISIGDFVNYFELINSLHESQKQEIREKTDSFEKDFLIVDCDIEYSVRQMLERLPELAREFIEFFDDAFSNSFKIEKMKVKDINTLLRNHTHIATHESLAKIDENLFAELKNYKGFLSNYKSHLPSLENELKKDIEIASKKWGNVINNAVHIISHLQKTFNPENDLNS